MSRYTPPPGDHVLKGSESQALRLFCSQAVWTAEDLDDLAIELQRQPVKVIKEYITELIEKDGLEETRKGIAALTYGPGKIGIYNYILQLRYTDPSSTKLHLDQARYLALDVKVPVDTPDLSGTTPFMHAISTKPFFDPEFADLMLEAGAVVNRRNRYGCVAAHESAMCRDLSPTGRSRSVSALKYFVDKGGDLDIADGDGVTPRRIGTGMTTMIPEFGIIFGTDGGTANTSSKPVAKVNGKKVGRNDPCICGSKRKYKVCCGKVA